MSTLFRRAFSASTSTSGAKNSLGSSMAKTAPRAVRERRAEFPFAQRASALTEPHKFGPGGEVWPEVLESQFQKMRERGQYKGDETSARAAFLKVNQAWRQRVRGGATRVAIKDGAAAKAGITKASFLAREGAPLEPLAGKGDEEYRDAILGQKVYLPNISITLVRNSTKPFEAYDPFVATFRIPTSMTKNDLRSYLHAVYGLDVTWIRTELRQGKIVRNKKGQMVREGGAAHNYKRAVVGLNEPFAYPDDVEEMRAGTFAAGDKEQGERQAQEREKMLNGEFLIEASKDYQKSMLMKILKGARWRGKTHANAVSGRGGEGTSEE